jgi:hypothetical protein
MAYLPTPAEALVTWMEPPPLTVKERDSRPTAPARRGDEASAVAGPA